MNTRMIRTGISAFSALAVMAAVLASAPALADPKHGRYGKHDRYDWARVVDARPITETVRIPVDRDVCWDERVTRRVPERRSPVPAIIGGVVGGVIGHQFGSGRGNDAATAAGAALGTAIAVDQQARRYPPRYYDTTVQRCSVEREWVTEERVVAWDVAYRYHGDVYHTRMREEPGDSVRVRVDVHPVH